jgi:hypothetical protein
MTSSRRTLKIILAVNYIKVTSRSGGLKNNFTNPMPPPPPDPKIRLFSVHKPVFFFLYRK